MDKLEEQLLNDAYIHCMETGNYEYRVTPANQQSFINLVNTAQNLKDYGYIEKLSDNLVGKTAFLVPFKVSFSITYDGIEYIRSKR